MNNKMTKEEKEKKKKELEEKHKIRDKQLLQMKASQELLNETLEWFKEKYKDDNEMDKNIQYIKNAIDDNNSLIEKSLGSNEHELQSLEYNTVKPSVVKEYYDRLKRQGKDDEEIHTKDLTKLKNGKKVMAQVTKKEKSTLQNLKDRLKNLTSSEKNSKIDTSKETIQVIENEVKNEEQSIVKEKIVNIENNVNKKIINDVQCKDFDPRDIPSYIQYDMIPLPSKGECYAHKKSYIPVAYLTAADENLITSRNMYENGSIINTILERKILDKSIRVNDLCKGDRDAIAIWLRATAYGSDYPILAPYNGEEIEATINLSDINYLDFDLVGDENGWFDYTTGNGDVLKFKVLSYQEEKDLIEKNINVSDLINRNEILNNLTKSAALIENLDKKDKEEIIESIDMIKNWVLDVDVNFEDVKNNVYSTYLTDKMFAYTMSVNGNTDREYIENYVNNMRAQEALNYRKYVEKNIPGVNLNITIPIPESLGGGSFNTFLSIRETIFINV